MKLLLRLAFIASLCSFIFAESHFVLLNPDGLIVPKSEAFIENLSSELKSKTGFSLYIVALDEIDAKNKAERDLFKQQFLNLPPPPYGIIFFFKSQHKIDIVLNPALKIDKNRIISQYMVPILIQDKELTPPKISASILNGYAQLADEIALHYGANLEQNLIVDRSGSKDYIHYLVYTMFGVMFGLIGIVYFLRKKR